MCKLKESDLVHGTKCINKFSKKEYIIDKIIMIKNSPGIWSKGVLYYNQDNNYFACDLKRFTDTYLINE